MDLSGLTQQAEATNPEQRVFTAQVVRTDDSGLWVVPIGEDPSSPVGPCKGGWTANGTRVPPGSLVALVMTDDGPWAIGVDNPALAIPDSGLAPFPNPSWEDIYSDPVGAQIAPGWDDFWSFSSRRGPGPGKYDVDVDDTGGAHGMRSVRVTGRGTHASVRSNSAFSVPAGSSLELTGYAKATGPDAFLNMITWSSNPATGGTTQPGPFGAGATSQGSVFYLEDGGDWIRYRAIVTLPPLNTRVAMIYDMGSDDPATTAVVQLDAVDVDVVEIDPAAAHQDFMRRAALVMLGGGVRQVTAGGNVSWSQSFTIAGAGMEPGEALDGRFVITQPANGTVIPVHSSAARTSHTVAGGVIALNPDDALWYELPIGAAATSQPGRFHIMGSSAADAYEVPAHWLLVVRRASAWSSTSFAQEYRWGDGRHQDPLRSPSLNGGWAAGTITPTFTKTSDQVVRMRGRVANGAGSAFTLPPGYRPAVTHDDFVRDGAGASALITVTNAGIVTTAGNNTDHSIATSFVADQP